MAFDFPVIRIVVVHKLIAIQEITHDPAGKTCLYALAVPS